jgi:type IV secretion system protein VirB2
MQGTKQRNKRLECVAQMALGALTSFASPGIVLAQAAPDFGGADSKLTGFLQNINGLLNLASIAVVTIAVIFAGYQIAFAHKRIADVAPILIGGFLIGAAAQIAKMLVGDAGAGVAVVLQSLSGMYA